MSIIQLNGALQGDHGSLAAAPAHIRVPRLTHIAVPNDKRTQEIAPVSFFL